MAMLYSAHEGTLNQCFMNIINIKSSDNPLPPCPLGFCFIPWLKKMAQHDERPGLKRRFRCSQLSIDVLLINTCMLMLYRLSQLCSTQPLPLALDPIVSVCSELAHWVLMVKGPQPFSQHTEAH